MLHSEGSHLDPIGPCGKREEELEGIPVGFDGARADALDMGKIMIEELMDARGEFHWSLFCHRVKSTRFLRLRASATLRYKLVYL